MNHDRAFTCQMDMAQRELGAFLRAVSDLYGSDVAAISADDWLDELKLLDSVPEPKPGDWRLVTVAAAIRLAARVNKQGVDKVV